MPREWVKQYFWVFLEEMSIGFSGLSGVGHPQVHGGPKWTRKAKEG